MKKIIVALLLLAVMGCGGILKDLQSDSKDPNTCKALSSGVIGCRTSEIMISDETSTRAGAGANIHEWVATCRGKQYVCSYAGRTTSCSEMKR
jgi:hypothetical protein